MANLMRNDQRGPSELAFRAMVKLADVLPPDAMDRLLREPRVMSSPATV